MQFGSWQVTIWFAKTWSCFEESITQSPNSQNGICDLVLKTWRERIFVQICSHHIYGWCLQIFTNSDERHAAEVLHRLGLEDCFERIICFETLNSSDKSANVDEENAPAVENSDLQSSISSPEIFNIMEYQPSSGVTLPPTPVVCKPFETSFEQTFKLAGIDPQRTVSSFFRSLLCLSLSSYNLVLLTYWHNCWNGSCSLMTVFVISVLVKNWVFILFWWVRFSSKYGECDVANILFRVG